MFGIVAIAIIAIQSPILKSDQQLIIIAKKMSVQNIENMAAIIANIFDFIISHPLYVK